MKLHLVLGIGLALSALSVSAASTALSAIQHQWAVCSYQIPEGDEREQCFEALVEQAQQQLKQASPDDKNAVQVWVAISQSSLAGEKGGLGALSLAKKARKTLMNVIADGHGDILDGAAYSTLGTLYNKVPGWPMGFGDDDKAKKWLKKALQVDPQGQTSNYFYAQFLEDQGKKTQAIHYYQQALAAPARVNRPIADEGRRQQIKARLAALQNH